MRPNRLKQLAFLVGAAACCFWAGACTPSETPVANTAVQRTDARVRQIARIKEPLVPSYQPMQIREGDWLDSFPDGGQTFEEYIVSGPTLPAESRKTIYIQPVGIFTAKQMRVIERTSEYMRAFYNLPVKLNAAKPLGTVPDEMSRIIFPNNRQIRASYFLDSVLPKLLPDDAAAFICFTNFDLYPEETWHFVFGQASLENRVGVWSLYRLEPKNAVKDPGRVFLSRTLKIAMHETGHMFSFRHCAKYECLMSGTNHLEETDRRPLDTCPECTAKVVWAMHYDPVERYNNLTRFWTKQGWKDEASLTDKKRAAVVTVWK